MLTVIADKKNINGNEILINDRGDCNHIQNVYRLNVGDSLRVIDGEYEYATEITGMGKKEIKLKIIEKKTDNYSLNINIDVALGILKNDKMNLAIQKLTEIGINKIIPLPPCNNKNQNEEIKTVIHLGLLLFGDIFRIGSKCAAFRYSER